MASKKLSKSFQLTPEQIALSEERKAKRQKGAAFIQPQQKEVGKIVERPWLSIELPPDHQQDLQYIKVFTWNVCPICGFGFYHTDGWISFKKDAGSVSRRELFPTSDCLKASQREHMMLNELLATQADVLCLQEVDRLEKILPALKKGGYAYHYAAAPGKKHGCLVAFKEHLYDMRSTRTIQYDIESIRSDGDERTRLGKSIRTKNIAILTTLQSKTNGNSEGVIVVTTHLFWHPKQAAILIRETVQYRTDLGLEDWPCILSGDFNFTPDDATYSIMVGDSVLPEQENRLLLSYVVHASVDPTVPKTEETVHEEGGAEAVDPDRVITSARPANPVDGLLTIAELKGLFSQLPRVRSTYDVGLSNIKMTGAGALETFGDRKETDFRRRGRHEPIYTSYTHFWKNTIDYIFVLDPVNRPSTITALLAPHKISDLEPGLPRRGVSSSDHVSLGAEMCWAQNHSIKQHHSSQIRVV